MLTGSHLKTWEESVLVRIFVPSLFPFPCGGCLPHQVNTGILLSFLEKRNFELKAQCLPLTTVYSSRSSCFAVLHSINRKEFTNGQCGKQGWFSFSNVSPTRNFMCHKKHWGFRFLGPLLILDNSIPRSMINYLFFMFIHSLTDRSNDRKSWNA